tara:strand:+ start:278 stop:667 length:390 start_codon:yes stop_codon:yes gene_type:complete
LTIQEAAITTNNPILSVRIHDIDALNSAYMPFIENGGIFLPSTLQLIDEKKAKISCHLNDKLCLLLQFFDEPAAHCCIAKVVWVTPVPSAEGQFAGFGFQFSPNDHQIKSLIESMLADHKTDALQTQTL